MPTDITQFFGKKSGSSQLRASKHSRTALSESVSSSMPRKRLKTNDGGKKLKSQQQEQPVTPKRSPAKRARKVVPMSDSDDDSNDNDAEFVPLEDEVKNDNDFMELGDDDDDDDEIVELLEEPKQSPKKNPKTQPKTKTQPKAAPESKKAAPESKKAARASPKKAAPVASKPAKSSSGNALDVLAAIPDCDLPEVDETEKVNFWAKKAELDSKETDESFKKPVGKPDCLAGLTIVFTGILPHLNREDCEHLAKEYGAKVTKSISGKTNVVVLGDEAGPSKVSKIKKLGIKHIDEAGFIQLIEGMPEAGGEGNPAAQKVLQKKLDDERKAQEAAEEEAREAERKDQERQARLRKAQAILRSDSNGPVDNYVKPSDRPDAEKLWTVKYAPTKISQICGNKGQVQKLVKWLTNWDKNKKAKFKYFGESFPAVLISGPPGIGKTTAAHIIAEDLGYDVIEKNASDVRSKNLLNQTIAGILDNTSVVGFFGGNKSAAITKNNNKLCLIMDEVDGMSSGDMGGVGALSAFCRKTSIPIILICNDKSLPKMRPFDRVTMDAPFRRPDATSIKSRILTIALREKIKLPSEIIERLVEYTNNDIRQIINLLSTVTKTTKNIDHSNYKEIIAGWEKNVAMKTFDIAGKYLSSQIWSANANVSLNEKIQYYFDDFSFVPLMVHENYMNTRPAKATGSSLEHLKLVAKAADSISEGDLVDRKIHSSEQQWSLMPFHAVMSSIRPSSFVHGQIAGRINFTSFLGNNSKKNKYERLLTDLNYHTKLATLTNKSQLRLNYLSILSEKLVDPLLESGSEGISKVIDVMDSYYLTKEDWEYLLDFNIGNSKYKFEEVSKKLSTPVKTAFTRKYNASKHPVAIYHVGVAGGGTKGGVSTQTPDFDDAVNDDVTEVKEENDEDDEDVGKDKLIKQKKASTKTAGKKAGTKAKTTTTKKRAPRVLK